MAIQGPLWAGAPSETMTVHGYEIEPFSTLRPHSRGTGLVLAVRAGDHGIVGGDVVLRGGPVLTGRDVPQGRSNGGGCWVHHGLDDLLGRATTSLGPHGVV